MLKLSAKIRRDTGKKAEKIRKNSLIPAVLYGPGMKNLYLEIDEKEFEKAYQQAGESSLIELLLDSKKFLVLIHALQTEPLTQKTIHIDFYRPKMDEEITVTVPVILEGVSEAVKSLGGTLVKNIHELEVRSLPQNLPHEIRADISRLRSLEDAILVKDLMVDEKIKILKEPDEIIAFASAPEKVEEELSKPMEEKVEDVEKVEAEKEKKEEEGEKEEKE